MKKRSLGMILLVIAILSALYVPRMVDNYQIANTAISNITETCVPDPEYFVDCIDHNDTRFNTTLLIDNRTIFIENASFSDHLEIWSEVLNDFPPHAVENIVKIRFNVSMASNSTAMTADYENQPGDKPCGINWTHYGPCVRSRIDVNSTVMSVQPRTSYKGIIGHEVGHTIKFSNSDINLFSYLHGINDTADNFITKYAMTANLSDEEDFAENIRFWRGNTPLLWKISQRNDVMKAKFGFTSRKMCFKGNSSSTLCPIYISQKSSAETPQNYNGTTDNYKGLFDKDLKRSNIRIMKNITDLNFEDFGFMEANFQNNGT